MLLEKDLAERSSFLSYSAGEPALDELRDDPRFKALLKQMNLLAMIICRFLQMKHDPKRSHESRRVDDEHRSGKDMSDASAIDLLFGGMAKLGPGSDADTLRVFEMLPDEEWRLVVDAGCGAGRQTLALAKRLQTRIDAIDSYEPFLASLRQRARAEGTAELIETHCFDMVDIPARFREIDLLWSEGAAYNIGFPHALQTWHPALRSGGFAVVSELSWLRDDPPAEVRSFFENGYPDMRSVEGSRSVAAAAGYEVVATHQVPPEAWVDGYYDVLGPRARALLDHPDASVRAFAAEMVEEIAIFNASEGAYGYVFYLLRK